MKTPPAPPTRLRVYLVRGLIWVFIALVFVVSIIQGLSLRRWVYDRADPVRFSDDLNNGCYWGLEASGPEGYFNQYDKMALQIPEWQDSKWLPYLDYAPLRLLVMRQWAVWQRDHHPRNADQSNFDTWQRPYEFTAPVLRFNIALELFSAACAFLLTRHWVRRPIAVKSRSHFLGVWQGTLAALFLWFSPDILINAHAWPQWDTWVIPWYLCACLLASLDWWFAAGVCVAIGAMLKGQMLSVSLILILWPLVAGRWGGALRWICGGLFGLAIIASPWLITYLPADRLAAARAVAANLAVRNYPPDLFAIPRTFDLPAIVWIVEMLILSANIPFLLRQLKPGRWRWPCIAAGALVLVASVYWPWLAVRNRPNWFLGLLAAIGVATAALLLRGRNQLYVWAAIAGGGLLSCIWLFNGSSAWWDCGIHFGTIHWINMALGPVSNMPAVFQIRFGWPEIASEIAFTLPAIQRHWPGFMTTGAWWPAVDWDVSAKTLFGSIYIFFLAISGVAVGLSARRNDRRMLVALATPWIMFFLFPTQIQERYLVYGAAVSACCIGQSFGMALLGFVLTIFSAMMEVNRMLNWHTADLDGLGRNLSHAFPRLFSADSGHTLLQVLDGTHPDTAWAILVITLVFLYVSLTPSARQ